MAEVSAGLLLGEGETVVRPLLFLFEMSITVRAMTTIAINVQNNISFFSIFIFVIIGFAEVVWPALSGAS